MGRDVRKSWRRSACDQDVRAAEAWWLPRKTLYDKIAPHEIDTTAFR